VSGRYTLGTFGFRTFDLRIADSLVAFAAGGSETPTYGAIELVGGAVYRFSLEGTCRQSGSLVQLFWEIPDTARMTRALRIASGADLVILTMGLSPRVEGEEMDVTVKGFLGGDRTDIALPESQCRLLRSVAALGKPVVLVLLNGSALAIPDIASVDAVVELWYPGQAGGTALAEVLFGDVNPSGRLPVTFYRSIADIPPFINYAMEGRTYRYFKGTALFPFGHGLSYTRFNYDNLRLTPARIREGDREVTVECDIANVGGRAGEEVVQLYLKASGSSVSRPLKELRGFQRVSLATDERKTVRFALKPSDCALYDPQHQAWAIEHGAYEVLVGASSEDIRAKGTIVIE